VTIVAPNLDDRRFQDLVDDAKRLIQQRCPDWTDHNVSDPGVTLIEAVAGMVDQLLYRLNRVPERHYVRMLELIGLRPFPPAAAKAAVTFWLSAPQQETVIVPAGTEVGTARTEVEEAVVFTTVAPLAIVSCELQHLATAEAERPAVARDKSLHDPDGLLCFGTTPGVGDALLVGLSAAVPSCVLTVRVECDTPEGVGVDPRFPPWTWEAWDGDDWVTCELHDDGTGGLNRSGNVVIHVPPSHVASVTSGRRAGWVRCRVVETVPGQRSYSASPRLRRMECFVVGGTAEATHAELVRNELLGLSQGVPGQRFPLQRRPVVRDRRLVLAVLAGAGWEEWAEVDSFAGQGKDDPVFMVDHVAGEVVLAPAVREPGGEVRQYGRVPPKHAQLRVREYRVGGGRRGNVAARSLRVLKSSVPYVDRVGNRRAAAGGIDAEDVENAKARGPLLLRTRDRAVTAEDYEELAREAAPEAARVRCVAAAAGAAAGTVKVLIVPAVGTDEQGQVAFEQLQPDEDTLAKVAAHLERHRVIGARVSVEPPFYRGVTVVAEVTARPGVAASALEAAALTALNRYFHPTTGGLDRAGWPFGRPVQAGDVFAVLQRLPECELVDDVKLFPADPISGERGAPTQRLEVPPNGLVHSYLPQVRVRTA
jgi:predicted phage baseplate assembly protein